MQADNYRLRIGNYYGTAGDSFSHSGSSNQQKNAQFSTMDKDNDDSGNYCAQIFGNGGWWFDRCGYSGLNGINFANGVASDSWDGISWFLFDNSNIIWLKTTTMSIIPTSST